MNERIKQLMGQTLDEKFSGTWSVMDMQDLTKFADRFAELIVRECASICLDMKYTNPQPHHYAVMIKEHFGVEE
jgi:hypothetical protein